MTSFSLGTLGRAAMIPVIFLALAGCATMDTSSSGSNGGAGGAGPVVPNDGDPYKALVDNENTKAFDKFSALYAQYPNDPYVQLDLGLANQRLGHMDVAEPLYRTAMVTGKDVYPDVVTSDDYKGHTIAYIACENIKIGLHTASCEPAPPLPPVVKTFIVFFDFDQSDLTDAARQVVTAAVAAAKRGASVKVSITGHTDTVGTHSYNQALSDRRAESVKAEMVSEGIDGGSISTLGKSFDDPLVATGPGVREPQNRRASIVLGD